MTWGAVLFACVIEMTIAVVAVVVATHRHEIVHFFFGGRNIE
jgi:hypothetical protein